MTVQDTMRSKLVAAFAPDHLVLIDESSHHIGHAGYRPGGETHFRLEIVAAGFAGKSRVERHRMVNAALAEELAGSIHALQMVIAAPGDKLGA